MIRTRNARLVGLVAALGLAFSMVAVDHADARRGGSFGSRGARTYQSAPATNTAPNAAAPVQRTTMQPNAAGPTSAAAAARPGFMNGFGGSLMRGLMLGGLLGLLFGGGFGGLAGMLGLLVQVALIALAVMLLMRFLRSRSSQPSAAATPQGMYREAQPQPSRPIAGIGARLGGGGGMRRPANPDELGISNVDLDVFERRLADLQAAYGREDYAALRAITTPEMMSYLSEELGQNASRGLVNEVRDVRLLQGDVAESWREGRREFATVAMRFSSIEATRERATGRVVEGDADHASESTELWTFVREDRGEWLLSAIQAS